MTSIDRPSAAVAPAAPPVLYGRRPPTGLFRRPAHLLQHRRVIGLLLRRDLKVRYASSVLGYLWSVLDPLLMALVYWFVFTKIFHRSVGESPYIVFLMCGLLPWAWFNSAVHDMARALRVDGKLVRSTNAPREIWVLRVVLGKGAEFLFSIPVLAGFAIAYSASVNWRLLLFVPAVLLQATLLLGIGLMVAPLVVMVRDLDRIIRVVLRVLFYASPVVYAVRDAPPLWNDVFAWNPLAGIIELCRAGFFPAQLSWTHVAQSTVVSLVILLLGWFVFTRLERTVLKEV